MLYRDGISANDVKQGAIGDCYLISSFAVLGEKLVAANELGAIISETIKVIAAPIRMFVSNFPIFISLFLYFQQMKFCVGYL